MNFSPNHWFEWCDVRLHFRYHFSAVCSCIFVQWLVDRLKCISIIFINGKKVFTFDFMWPKCSKSFCRYFGQQIPPLANNYISPFEELSSLSLSKCKKDRATEWWDEWFGGEGGKVDTNKCAFVTWTKRIWRTIWNVQTAVMNFWFGTFSNHWERVGGNIGKNRCVGGGNEIVSSLLLCRRIYADGINSLSGQEMIMLTLFMRWDSVFSLMFCGCRTVDPIHSDSHQNIDKESG